MTKAVNGGNLSAVSDSCAAEPLLEESKLHPYQKFCVDFLEAKPQCALFLDCGLGKTVITLTAISHLLYDSYEVSRVLIISSPGARCARWNLRRKCMPKS